MTKEFLKDYGTLIGPVLAFGLGVVAILIKFYLDRWLEKWKTEKRIKKLIGLIKSSPPPKTYFPNKSQSGFIHADEARNLTNLSIFLKKIEVIESVIDKIEESVLTNSSNIRIQQLTDIKFIVRYYKRDLYDLKNNRDENFGEFEYRDKIIRTYERMLTVCDSPKEEFRYIE
jgi:hypothetical protein